MARHRYLATKAQLRAMLTDARRRAAKDETAVCELTRHNLRLTRRLQEAEAKAASWLRASDELAGRVLDQAAEIKALRGEKNRAWADAANANKVGVPAPGADPESAFYSGEDTAENPLPPDQSPGDWVDTTPDDWRGEHLTSEDTVPTDTRALTTPGLDGETTVEIRVVAVPYRDPANPAA